MQSVDGGKNFTTVSFTPCSYLYSPKVGRAALGRVLRGIEQRPTQL